MLNNTCTFSHRYAAIQIILILVSTCPGESQTVEDRITAILGQMTTEEKIKQLHREGGFNTADNTRLGIPGLMMADGPHGVRDGNATSFPVTIGMASTWDVELAERVGIALGEEFRGKGKHQALGPSMDLDRDPRNGRSAETGGEDPFLAGSITSAMIRGIQSTGYISTAKHYNCNHRESGRETNNIVISQRLLMDQAGLQFRMAVQEGNVLSVMNAYNLVNGQKSAESANLLTTILRTAWGFAFYVVSDWGAVWNTRNAITAGTDICMGSAHYQNDLPSLVQRGIIPMSVIDEAVRRVLRTKMLAGLMDNTPFGDPGAVNSPQHQQLCLEAGRKSLVLLKNHANVLPLNASSINTIAVIGPSAAVLQIDGSGSAYVTPFYTVTPLQAVQKLLGVDRIRYARGCDINSTDTSGFTAAVLAATGADAVLFFGGLDPSQEGEGFDRTGGTIELPGRQKMLIQRIADVNPNIIATIFSGGICGVQEILDNIRGLLYAFYPGQEGGTAVADVIFGNYNPGGKLPVTMPRSTSQLPPWNDNLNDDYGGGYRWFDAQLMMPQFAFGFGLSYTSFAYSNFSIDPSPSQLGQPITVGVDVTNTGSRGGDEVVQLYITKSSGSIPMRELKAFKRITLTANETRRVNFIITPEQLYSFNETTSRYEVATNSYPVRVGGSSDNLPVGGTLQILNAATKPDLRITKIWMVPRFPVTGDSVIFLASVKNEGTGPSPAGTPVNVAFSVNGTPVCFSDEFTQPIVAGGMALICANRGVSGSNRWSAAATGSFTVTCTLDPANTIDETREENNTATTEGHVYPPPPANLAIRKPVVVSSVQGPGLEGENAVDGSMGTRWASGFTDPQTITVDLAAQYRLEELVIYWESAFARSYVVMLSADGIQWSIAFSENMSDGGIDLVPLSADARFVRIVGLQRATPWGYSIYEILVHGSGPTGVTGSQGVPLTTRLYPNYPNPFNPTTTLRYDIAEATHVSMEIYNMLGQKIEQLRDGTMAPGRYDVTWNAEKITSGVYFCRLRAGSHIEVRKMLLTR